MIDFILGVTFGAVALFIAIGIFTETETLTIGIVLIIAGFFILPDNYLLLGYIVSIALLTYIDKKNNTTKLFEDNASNDFFNSKPYINHCWYCGHSIDSRRDERCPKCKKHYICPHCGKCYCDSPMYRKY